MKINVVSVEDSLISVGVRKVSAFIRELNPDTTPYYISLSDYRSIRTVLRPSYPERIDPKRDAKKMAESIADADIVAFSAMTHVAEDTVAIIQQVRRINPAAYIIWGGIHPIIVPEDAIRYADAICTGEGEFAFQHFFEAYKNGRDYTSTPNFWFNLKGHVKRNPFAPLMSSSEMDTLPLPTYGGDEFVYRRKKGTYTKLTQTDYIRRIGLAYNTVWVIGCPFKCTYCGNTKFIENDRAYTRLRYSRPERIVDEIAAARHKHTHIDGVVFHDDSFLALPVDLLQQFASLYKQRIDIPFCIQGVIPNFVKREKIEILIEAGMNRVRMGIQSGSKRILEFYKRPSPPAKILEASNILADYSKYTIPPSFDMITENPIETRQDVVDTLELIYRMRRPFTFNIFSLRVQPNTDLAMQFKELNITADSIAAKNYLSLRPTYSNCLLVFLGICRPPRWLFDRLLNRVKPMTEEHPNHPRLLFLLRVLLFVQRGLAHLRFMDFSVLPGRLAGIVYRLGIAKHWRRWMIPGFKRTVQPKRRPSKTKSVDVMLPVLLIHVFLIELTALGRYTHV